METLNATFAHTSSPEASFKPVKFLTTRYIFSALAVYIVGYGVFATLQTPTVPASIPWMGRQGKGWLAGLIASFRVAIHGSKWNREGYQRYNKAGKSFALPGLPGSATQIVLPRSQMKWIVEQPDSVLSVREAHYISLHGAYSFIRPDIVKYPYHEKVLRRYVPKRVNGLIPGIEDEVRHSFDLAFGTDTQNFKSVNLWDTLVNVISRISNRMFIGLPANRDQEYLDNMIGFNDNVVRNMLILTIVPEAIRPILGPIAGLPGRYHWKRSQKHTLPIIRQRLRDFERKAAGDPEYKDWTPPNDYISWHIELAIAENRQDELTEETISIRLCPLNFASIHTTTLVTHAFLLDILSLGPAREYLTTLTDEVSRVWAEEGGKATKEGMNKLIRVDSAIRESMRASPISQTNIGRVVVAPEGVVNEAEGWHVPKGTTLSVNMYNILNDPELLDGPDSFDPFRSSRKREEWEAKPQAEKEEIEEALKIKRLGMITTNDKHFPWGHGRHICPGRFFVAHEMKIMISYLLRNYELKPLETRPEHLWIGWASIPPTKARIELRRKPGTVGK